MRKNLLSLSLLFGLALGCTSLYAQAPGPVYLIVEHMKVMPGQEVQYLEIENAWKGIHEQRIRDGIILSWNLYAVRYPAGAARPYDYVTVTMFNSLDHVETPYPDTLFTQVLTPEQMPPFLERTEGTRTLVRGELWVQLDGVFPQDPNATPSRYALLDLMKVEPGEEETYLRMERELAKPLHQERMKADKINGWALFGIMLPGGTGVGYNYATANFFDTMSDLADPYPVELISTALPGRDMNNLIQEIVDAREIVRSELWELVDSAR